MRQILKLHPDSRCDAVTSILAEASQPTPGGLRLRYLIEGDLPRIALPPRPAPARPDELWRRTCVEAFVHNPEAPAYLELNVAPSTEWAAYRFTAYRDGMTVAELPEPPRIEVAIAEGALELAVDLR